MFTKRFSNVVKKKLVKTLVWTTLLYGCETWTTKEGGYQKTRGCRDVDIEEDGEDMLVREDI